MSERMAKQCELQRVRISKGEKSRSIQRLIGGDYLGDIMQAGKNVSGSRKKKCEWEAIRYDLVGELTVMSWVNIAAYMHKTLNIYHIYAIC